MSAERELIRAYSEWRRLAEAEGKAIQSRNWPLLADCQRAIQDFQKHVSRLTLEARDEWKRSEAGLAEKEKRIQAIVNELIAITRRNHEWLITARAAAKERLAEIGFTRGNLHRLKRSYSPGQPSQVLETA